MEIIENDQLKLARDFILFTGKNVFLTGKAGTGKTTFLHNLKTQSDKRMIVVAPTGVAAINAGGVTIHSFFQMPFGPYIPNGSGTNPLTNQRQGFVRRFSKEKINIIRGLDLLIIDEISMVRADLMDGIDEVLKRYRDRNKPFGGVQLLMIGDLHQLAPVIKDDEWSLLKKYYQTGFFFSSHALGKTRFISIELKEIFRQSDQHFIELLGKIRENKIDSQVQIELSKRYKPDFKYDKDEGYITLTTHNVQAQRINESKLAELSGKVRSFTAKISGDFPGHLYPTEECLELKEGSQVMFVKNDSSSEKRYYNGKIGELERIEDDILYVQCEGEDDLILVDPEIWENQKYSINEDTKAIEEEVVGSFTQYPLKLAWAITIHKSQGLTFEKAIIDARAAFAHGQVYVALSRCKSLEGLVLSSPLREEGIITNREILTFTHDVENNPPDNRLYVAARHEYQAELLEDLFDFEKFHWSLRWLIKISIENASSLPGNIGDKFIEIDTITRKEISTVSDRFKLHLKKLISDQPDIESNEHLQKRVKDASRYFVEKINKVISGPVSALLIESDNRAVRKSINESLDKLRYQVSFKMACLEACKNGFVMKDYLRERGKAAVDVKDLRKKWGPGTREKEAHVKHPDLYDQLKAWRKSRALEEDKSENLIITLRTLINISNLVPITYQQLKRIQGVGEKAMEYIDEPFMLALIEYRAENDIEEIEEKPKKKSETQRISFDLFNSGKTITEIAKQRGFAHSTIESHLAYFIGTGELSLDKIISSDKSKPVIEYFRTADVYGLTPAKETLGKDYSYGELRMVLQHLKYKGEIKEE